MFTACPLWLHRVEYVYGPCALVGHYMPAFSLCKNSDIVSVRAGRCGLRECRRPPQNDFPRAPGIFEKCMFDPPTLEIHSQTCLNILFLTACGSISRNFPFSQNLSPRPPTYPKTTPSLHPTFPISFPHPPGIERGTSPHPHIVDILFCLRKTHISVRRKHILCLKKAHFCVKKTYFLLE